MPKATRPHWCHGDVAADEMWRALTFHLSAVYEGRHPPHDWRGRDWPEGSWAARLAGEQICGGSVRVIIFPFQVT